MAIFALMKQRFLLVLLLVFCTWLPSKAQLPVANDLVVVLHQETLNKLFAALGEISGTEEYEVLLMKKKYTWFLSNMRIQLQKDSAAFTTDATVDAGFGVYKDQVIGKVAIDYDEKRNKISVKVVDAVFEIFINFMGKRLVIKRVQLANYLTTPFTFEGPMTLENEMTFQMPDGSEKKLFIKPSRCTIKVENEKIVVSTEIDFFHQKLFIKNK